MTLHKQLQNASAAERRGIKAKAWANAKVAEFITRDGWRIEFTQPLAVNAAGVVSLWLRITDPDGQVVPLNNPLIVVNPPVAVRTGDAEDVPAAMLAVIARAVRDTTGRAMPEVA
jgi:hypothetical protein